MSAERSIAEIIGWKWSEELNSWEHNGYLLDRPPSVDDLLSWLREQGLRALIEQMDDGDYIYVFQPEPFVRVFPDPVKTSDEAAGPFNGALPALEAAVRAVSGG